MASATPRASRGLTIKASRSSSAAPAKRREHQDAGIFVLRGDKFLGDEVHAVAQWRHQSDLGGAVDAGEPSRECMRWTLRIGSNPSRHMRR